MIIEAYTLTTSILAAVLFFVGASIGSYMDVVVSRGSWKESFKGRSHCGHCHKTLHWYELIPIVSYITLKGSCSACKTKIPRLHLLSEFLMGSIFALAFVFITDPITFFVVIATAIFVVPIVVRDIECMEVPEHLSLPFAYKSLGISSVIAIQTSSILPFVNAILLTAPFFIIWYVTQGRGMGLGDAKVAVSLGLLAGTLTNAIAIFVFTFWIGTLWILGYMLYQAIWYKKYTIHRGMELPLIPFMAAAFFLVLITGIGVTDVIGVFGIAY